MIRIIVRAMNGVCNVKVTNTDNYDDAMKAFYKYTEEGYKRIDIFECNESVAKFYELEDDKWMIA